MTTHGPFGEPERASGRRLPLLRASLVLALCGAAIGIFAVGAAVADNPRTGVYLAGGIPPVARNVFGMTGIGLIFCLVTSALTAWIGPLAYTAISQFALIANYSEPLTWPAADRPGRLVRRHGRLRRRPDRLHHQGSPRPPVRRVRRALVVASGC